jgi:hypothetical protein
MKEGTEVALVVAGLIGAMAVLYLLSNNRGGDVLPEPGYAPLYEPTCEEVLVE